jgi:hypothetical protein
MASVRKQLVLDPEEDRDILLWLERQDNQSAAIRAAIRQAIRPQEKLDESRLRQVLREELCRSQITVSENDESEPLPSITEDVDPEAGRLLDEMF